ncbi:MAG: FtsW/RodA/SpoVE family cell cycle protein, partial [Anaerolineae bacterium]|nr:FtsW/RodA/SpoVE family cell cycle protein [Anaerolineae bacterium]
MLLAIALACCLTGAIALQLQTQTDLLSSRSPLLAVGVLSLVSLSLHFWLNRFAPNRTSLLLPCMALLTGIGLLVITRVAANFLARQLTWLCISAVAFAVVISLRDELRWLRRFKYTWLLLAFVLLVGTLGFGVNPAGTGARLWLGLGGLFLQPSELLRLFMIGFLAAFFAERWAIGDWRLRGNSQSPIANRPSLAPSLVMWLIAVTLLFVQQDLGAAVLLLGTFVSML